jgi:hypothetical protein
MRLIALCLLALVASTAAFAQRTGHDAALWNARAAVGELGWRAPDDAYAAIVEVHLRRAQLTGTSAALMARRYSAAIRRPPRHRRWVRELRVSASPPPSWPPHLGGAWQRYAEQLEHVRELASDVLAGRREVACEGATHYGGLMDSTPAGHAEACRWTVGRGAQLFFRRENLANAALIADTVPASIAGWGRRP